MGKNPPPLPSGTVGLREGFTPLRRFVRPRPPPTTGHLSVQDDVYRDRCSNPATIRGYVRGLDDLLMWAGALKVLQFLRIPPWLKFLGKKFWLCPPPPVENLINDDGDWRNGNNVGI